VILSFAVLKKFSQSQEKMGCTYVKKKKTAAKFINAAVLIAQKPVLTSKN